MHNLLTPINLAKTLDEMSTPARRLPVIMASMRAAFWRGIAQAGAGIPGVSGLSGMALSVIAGIRGMRATWHPTVNVA